MAFSLVRQPVFKDDSDIPEARTGSCVAIVDQCMYVWGGHTQLLIDNTPVEEILPNTDDNYIGVYNIHDNSWHQVPTTGDVPDLGNGSTFVAYLQQILLFGGWNEGEFSNDVYCFDTRDNSWKLIAVLDDTAKPSPRYLTGAVLVCEDSGSNKLCVFGGVGSPIEKLQKGARYIGYRSHARDFGFGWNNEMFLFDIEKKAWAALEVVGERPPPCGGFSFNMIDSHRALLFGGRQELGRVSDVYIFDLTTRRWSPVISQAASTDLWPKGRTLHTTCCLIDPAYIDTTQKRLGCSVSQRLFVMWGKGDDNKHCRDCWILEVDSMKWKPVGLELQPRMWHMACSCYYENGQTDMLLYGGNKQRQSGSEKHVMTDLTIFTHGVLSLKQLCLELIRSFPSVAERSANCPPSLTKLIHSYFDGYKIREKPLP